MTQKSLIVAAIAMLAAAALVPTEAAARKVGVGNSIPLAEPVKTEAPAGSDVKTAEAPSANKKTDKAKLNCTHVRRPVASAAKFIMKWECE